MNDKSKRIRKIIIIILICILLIVILKIISSKNSNAQKIDDIDILEGSLDFDLNKVKKIQSRSDYCLVKGCIEKFYKYNTSDKDVYSLLDNEYIELFDVKKDELQGKFGDFEKVSVDITRNVLF
ncbi:MAG: hypothetical protein J6A29_01845 [Clostridia bacterium]|nr:hypothetical protein [Clostridia bacterium]